jgi:hypothetical protein
VLSDARGNGPPRHLGAAAWGVCAENNGDRFSNNLFPIPQADKPDF